MTDGPVALVTGATSGIGAAVAAAAVNEGWRVAATGRRRERLAAMADELGVLPLVADLGEPVAPERLVRETVDRFGRLDCVVANAGAMSAGTVLDVEPAEWDRILTTNLTSVYLLARAALPHLITSGGTLVAVSSIAALRTPPSSAAYAVSKAALVSLVQSVARDFAGQGVRANVVCPGWVRTEMADGEMDELGSSLGLDRAEAYAEVTRLVPQGRPAEPAEVASAVLWLAGKQASYVTGACLVVDGGTVLVDPGTVAFHFAVRPRG